MRNAGLHEVQAGIKIAWRNINNLRYAGDTTLMAESEEELKPRDGTLPEDRSMVNDPPSSPFLQLNAREKLSIPLPPVLKSKRCFHTGPSVIERAGSEGGSPSAHDREL